MSVKMIENENGELVPNPEYNREEDGDCYFCGIKGCLCGDVPQPQNHYQWPAITDPAPIQQQPKPKSILKNSNPAPLINQVAPQQQTPSTPYEQADPLATPTFEPPAYAPPAYKQPAFSPQQTEIPMAQMQDWSAPQSYGGYNDGPVKRSRAICIIL